MSGPGRSTFSWSTSVRATTRTPTACATSWARGRASISRWAPCVWMSAGDCVPRPGSQRSSSRSGRRSEATMTDSSDPRRPFETPEEGEHHPSLPERLESTVEAVGEAVGRVEHRVEHAAEEVAEEVAGHVPAPLKAPVRWTVKRLVLVIGLGVVLVVGLGVFASGYYAWNHTQWAAHELAERVNRILRQHSNVELSVGGVRGNPLSTVDVIEPRILWRDEPGAPILEARRMRLRYSTWNLLSSHRGALVIELDRPVMTFGRGPDG